MPAKGPEQWSKEQAKKLSLTKVANNHQVSRNEWKTQAKIQNKFLPYLLLHSYRGKWKNKGLRKEIKRRGKKAGPAEEK
jgi:hypothetical protein